jgi:hypothetical protein
MTQHSKDEMVEMFLQHLRDVGKYWATVKLPDDCKPRGEQSETEYRIEGALFSFLVMLDGGAGDMPAFHVVPDGQPGAPAFHIVPDPHPDDEQYHRDQGEDWWPTCTLEGINDFSINWDEQMHERFHQK